MIARFFRLNTTYDNPLDTWRSVGLFVLTWVMVAGWAIWLALVAAPAMLAGVGLTTLVLPALAGAVVLIFILALLQMRRLEAASWLFVGLVTVLCILPLLNPENVLTFTFLTTPTQLVIPLVAAGLLLNRTGLAIVALFVFAVAFVRSALVGGLNSGVSTEVFALFATLVAVTILLLLFGRQARRAIQQLTRERQLMQASAAYVDTAMASRDESDLLLRTVQMVRDDMGYAYAQLFVVDGTAIRQVVRPGLSGQTAAENATPADSALVTQVAQTQAPRMTTINESNRLLAPVKSALTLPVMAGNQLLAVLDVHSEQAGFSAGEQAALDALSRQLAANVAELRLVDDMQRMMNEQNAVLDMGTRGGTGPQSPSSASRPATSPVVAQQVLGFDMRIGMDGPLLTAATELTPSLQAALESAEPVVTINGDIQRLTLPVHVRGETLGVMTFDVPLEQVLGERQLALARMVAHQLGQAFEGAHQLEQSELQAVREHKASEVSATLIAATDVRAVLAIAAETFNEAMGAVATRVTLQPDTLETAHSDRREGVAP